MEATIVQFKAIQKLLSTNYVSGLCKVLRVEMSNTVPVSGSLGSCGENRQIDTLQLCSMASALIGGGPSAEGAGGGQRGGARNSVMYSRQVWYQIIAPGRKGSILRDTCINL